VTREAIADGYDTCAVTSVPAADVEGAVLDHVQKLLAAPELVERTWAAAKRGGEDEITEREVTVLLAEFAMVWNELFPAEQARIVQLLVERVDVREDALKIRITAEGSRAWSASCGRTRGGRHDAGRRHAVGWQHAGRADPDAVPAPRWTQAHRRTRRERDRGQLEAAA
jgi:hypothetical protein